MHSFWLATRNVRHCLSHTPTQPLCRERPVMFWDAKRKSQGARFIGSGSGDVRLELPVCTLCLARVRQLMWDAGLGVPRTVDMEDAS